MASIERTAYPRFKRFLSARELHVFYTPQLEEIAWAKSQVRSAEHLLALMVQLKCFNRMGHFPSLDDVPDVVVAHIRRALGLGEDVAAVYDSDRTRKSHRTLIRRRSGVVSDMPAARAVAAAAIAEAAARKNDPADLINVALEKLVEGSFELPGLHPAPTGPRWRADQRRSARPTAGPTTPLTRHSHSSRSSHCPFWSYLGCTPSPWLSWAAASLPAEPEPILAAIFLAEELEHACPRQALGQRGGLLLRARLLQAAQQPGQAARVVEQDVGGRITGQQRGDLLRRARRPQKTKRVTNGLYGSSVFRPDVLI